ncbi:helix-turn-helix transcriptional regulator [Blastococcus tunisiensis]|uniref:DNA-binding transcriptional regulator, MarR family n=1 Tax=Blastococcus tunisiensis TaxID=1798228 RepID=A0A1I2KE25_9ACTN|nr:winged helix-turn-helix domain-containing protein [Blastococcus sp. DSM 46838]SFF63467.1 DNA-binding transcriptional regulator, MarR family [Blastococcus sp. DSM 46838]
MVTSTPGRPAWTFLTNHAHVLLAVARNPDALVADVAAQVGVTPRAALSILRDLEEAGYLVRTRRGRRTHYEIRPHQHFRHPSTAQHEVDGLLDLLGRERPSSLTAERPPPPPTAREDAP